MNCASARNRILASTDPRVPSESVRSHLDGCPACRTWHRVVVEVEGAIATFPIPEANGHGKRQLLLQFQSAPAKVEKSKIEKPIKIIKSPLPKAVVRPAKARQPIGERLARLWPAGLIAAAVLVGAIAWAIYGGKQKDNQALASLGPDPMLKEVVAAKINLDKAPDSLTRVEVLSRLAETIHLEAGSLSKVTPGEEMSSLAGMYDQVVSKGLVPQAQSLTAAERREKLPAFKEKLEKAEQEANRLAAEAPVGSDRPLKKIAETARTGRIELAKLIQGGA